MQLGVRRLCKSPLARATVFFWNFTCPGDTPGFQILPAPTPRAGPLPKNLRPEASEAWRLAEARVLRVLEALGGSFARILRVLEALGGSFVCIYVSGRLQGGPTSNEPKAPGGSPS